jgi:hypothetical protein
VINKVKSLQKTAKIVGALFLIAMAASLMGAVMIESILSSSDYFNAVSENKLQLLMGIFLELINGISVVGIGALMFPILKKQNENMARSYLCMRVIEAVLCCTAVITPLALIKLKAGALAAQDFQAAGSLLIAARAGILDVLVPVFFCLGAALFYSLLYQSRLLPRFIPVWGIIAVILIFAVNLFGLFQTTGMKLTIQMSLALPIILNEIFLGIWLIVKGFNLKNKIIGDKE